MQNISDQQGRALEYAIVAEINRRIPSSQLQLTQRALQDQHRDLQKYLNLSASMQHDYQRCAERLFDWLDINFSISNQPLLIDRLPDRSSQQKDVTDIRISVGSQNINLSIKNNNLALKHQRPASTAQHCGYRKGSSEDMQFRRDYRNLTETFLTSVQGYSYFRDLSPGVVARHLYYPICNLVSKFINNFCGSQEHANHLFTFLVGRIDFYKIIFNRQRNLLLIQEFSKLSSITSITVQNNQSYVYLQFSKAWEISMRLHTASSRITNNPSLKFDTQPVNIIVPEQQLIV